MAHPKLDYDYCSCPKPDGWWGEGGWHFRLAGESHCFERFGSKAGDGTSACLRGISDAKCREKGGCRYAETPLVIERCPRWQEARRKALERKRRDEAAGTAGKIFA